MDFEGKINLVFIKQKANQKVEINQGIKEH
jgi:hypothetical protein